MEITNLNPLVLNAALVLFFFYLNQAINIKNQTSPSLLVAERIFKSMRSVLYRASKGWPLHIPTTHTDPPNCLVPQVRYASINTILPPRKERKVRRKTLLFTYSAVPRGLRMAEKFKVLKKSPTN
ncbi:hypothetical protein YC2023_123015 [Brassica napus]